MTFIALFSAGTPYAQEQSEVPGTAKVEEKIIDFDTVAIKVGKRIFYLSELNQLLQDISKLSCLGNEQLALGSVGLKVQKYFELQPVKTGQQQYILINKLVNLLQIQDHITSLESNGHLIKSCRDMAAKGKNIETLLKIEGYLRSRFLNDKGVDQRALKVFIDTSFQKVSYEILI